MSSASEGTKPPKPIIIAQGDDPNRTLAGLYALCLGASIRFVEAAVDAQDKDLGRDVQVKFFQLALHACEGAFWGAPSAEEEDAFSPEQERLNQIWASLSALLNYAKGNPNPWAPSSTEQSTKSASGSQLPLKDQFRRARRKRKEGKT